MVSDPWMNSFQVAHELGLRDTPDRPRQKRRDPDDDRLMEAFRKRYERGKTVPRPDGYAPNGEPRWYRSTIVDFRKGCEGDKYKKRGRRGAGSEARHA